MRKRRRVEGVRAYLLPSCDENCERNDRARHHRERRLSKI